ncbi:MAG: molybdopterin converting factor subunit 1 [Hyphomicrobiales bacterium]
MQVLYFAWVRERTGKMSEQIDLPSDVETVADLIDLLKQRGEEYEHAFADLAAIRAAIDQEHRPLEASLKNAKEVAFFPPVTGG